MPFRFLEHTADMRVQCTAPRFDMLLETASQALYAAAFGHIADRIELSHEIRLSAESPEEMLVRWLQELIFLMEVERFVGVIMTFEEANAHSLHAFVEGYTYEEGDRAYEVKAATYHGMTVEQKPDGWSAEIVLDL